MTVLYVGAVLVYLLIGGFIGYMMDPRKNTPILRYVILWPFCLAIIIGMYAAAKFRGER